MKNDIDNIKIEDQILAEISEFRMRSGISERKFGLAAAKDHKLVSRLRKGREVYSGTINAIRNYIKNYNLSN